MAPLMVMVLPDVVQLYPVTARLLMITEMHVGGDARLYCVGNVKVMVAPEGTYNKWHKYSGGVPCSFIVGIVNVS